MALLRPIARGRLMFSGVKILGILLMLNFLIEFVKAATINLRA
jgi:hypothetical protein